MLRKTLQISTADAMGASCFNEAGAAMLRKTGDWI